MERPFRRHRGVGLFRNRNRLPGSNFRISKSGKILNLRPTYETTYSWPGGYPYDSIEEARAAVDRVLGSAARCGVDVDAMVEELNRE